MLGLSDTQRDFRSVRHHRATGGAGVCGAAPVTQPATRQRCRRPGQKPRQHKHSSEFERKAHKTLLSEMLTATVPTCCDVCHNRQ